MAERRFQEALDRLWEDPAQLSAEIHVLRIFQMWDAVQPSRIIDALKRITTHETASQRVRSRAAHLLGLAHLRIGEVTAARESMAALGFIDQWAVAGPFSNEGGMGLDAVYAPEAAEERLFADEPMAGKGHDVYWRDAPRGAMLLGFMDLSALHNPSLNSCFYARSVVDSDQRRRGVLRIGAGGVVKAFWNGRQVLVDPHYRMSDPDRLAIDLAVEKGPNVLLVKTCTEEKGDFGFYARLTDRASAPLPTSPRQDQLDALSVRVDAPDRSRRSPQPAEILLARAQERHRDAATMGIAAEYLFLTRSQDLNTTEARDLAKSACRLGRVASGCLLWAGVAADRNEQRRALSRAKSLAPSDPEVLLSLARWEMDGPEPAKALPWIARIHAADSDSLEGKLLELALLSRRGFEKSAYRDAERLMKQHPGLPGLIDLSATLADAAGFAKQGRTLREAGASFDFDSVSRHEEAAVTALATGAAAEMERHIEAMRTVAPSSDATYVTIARLLEGKGDLPGAEAALRDRLALAPRNADAWTDLGLYHLRRGHREEGVQSLITASAHKPQDSWLSEYLRHLGPASAFEEPYAIPEALFLSWRDTASPGNASRYLVDQSVVKVYESGLSSRFVQQVFEIRSREDAKQWRTQYIQFLPGRQEVRVLAARVFHPDGTIEKVVRRGTIPISEPWYRLYYDVAAEAMSFPMLSPGDVVELRYRVDDVAARNMFNDYFGDFVFIEDFTAKHYWRYALIAPEGRSFRFNAPSFPGLERSVSQENGTTVYSFQAETVPALHREGDMPGLVEVADHLHVSTYESWAEMGAWYRGLVRHQMIPDARIREKVRALTNGKRTALAKIEAIYNWVVSATRYVGLEFGIHGYKPYRAPLVMSRGFGDCKDKASLLVSMLTEAGIEAEFVLIRTNDLGKLPAEPASLSVFNHAIVHVPSHGLYLDGTAEQHGIRELPFGDQDATAVLLGREGARFVTTPVAAPEANATHVTMRVVLDSEGDAEIETSASVRGTAAAPLRKLLETEATRRKRFESSLAAVYPGAALGALTVTSISDLSKPAVYTFEATVPAFATAEGDTLAVPIDKGLSLVEEYARLPERAYDLILGAPRVLSQEVTLALPPGFRCDGLPQSVDIESAFGSLRLTVETQGERVVISRRFVFSAHRVSPEDYGAFVAFCREVDAALATRLVLRRAG